MNVGKCCEQQFVAVKLLSGTPVCASEADARGEHDAVNRSGQGLFGVYSCSRVTGAQIHTYRIYYTRDKMLKEFE